MSDIIDIKTREQIEDEAEQAAYDRAADIAMEMIEHLPDRVEAADADPMDAAYCLWMFFTGVLLGGGWTACDLAETAHELQAEQDEEVDGDEDGAVH